MNQLLRKPIMGKVSVKRRSLFFSTFIAMSALVLSSLVMITPASAAPAVTDVTPTSGTYAGGTDITITGTGFASERTSVTVGGAAVTNLAVNEAGTSITAKTPAGTVGERDIVVTVTGDGAGSVTSTTKFTYLILAPITTSRLPASGSTAGGTTLVINGTNLEVTTGVTIGGVAATIVGAPSATSVTVTTPAGTAGEQVVALTTPGGTVNNLRFTYVAAPTVTAIAPATGLDTGGTAVTITGTNLLGATSVTIGGVAATSVVITSATTITAVTPANTSGAKNVVVTTAGGSGTLASGFTYTASLAITPATQTPAAYTAGVAITATTAFEATGFGGAPTYAISPTPPAGLSFNTTTGVLSGTPTTNQAATLYTITATRAGVTGSATATITISIAARIMPPSQTINASAGSAITATTAFTASGFTGTVVYSVSPALPAGLSLNTTTGVITGTPTTSQSARAYTITATGTTAGSTTGTGVDTALVTITIGASLSPTSRTVAVTQNQAMTPTAAYTATGFSGAVSYSVNPALPSGLALNTLTGVISGTPTVISGAVNYVITASGATSGNATTTLTLSVLAQLAAPSGVTATAGDASVTVSWNAVSGATSYQVAVEPAAGACAITGTTANCTGLTNGTKYAFRVTAVNQAGASTLSTLSAQVTPKPPFVTKTGKLTITYSVTGTVVPAASLTRIKALGAQFKSDRGTAAVVSVKGFTSRNATALEKRLAANRATLVTTALKAAGLAGTYTTVGNGVTSQTGARARKVVITYTYTAPN